MEEGDVVILDKKVEFTRISKHISVGDVIDATSYEYDDCWFPCMPVRSSVHRAEHRRIRFYKRKLYKLQLFILRNVFPDTHSTERHTVTNERPLFNMLYMYEPLQCHSEYVHV